MKNLESLERKLLGNFLFEANAFEQIAYVGLVPAAFTKQMPKTNISHSDVFKTMLGIFEDKLAIDLELIQARLKNEHEKLNPEDIYSDLFILRLGGVVPDNIAAYAEELKKEHLLRVAETDIKALYKKLVNRDLDADDFHNRVDQLKENVTNLSPAKNITTEQRLYADWTTRVEPAGLESGFYSIDKFTGGFKPGQLIILGARTSIGKTAVALNMAKNMNKKGNNILFLSFEMSENEIFNRLLSIDTEIELKKIATKNMDQSEFNKCMYTATQYPKNKLFIEDRLLDYKNIESLIRNNNTQNPDNKIEVLFIDYLSFLVKSTDRVVNEIGKVTKYLKNLARKLEIPIVLLCQLNRASVADKVKRPQLIDLRDSGNLEQDADMVIMLHRPNFYADEPVQGDDEMEVFIRKNRNGSTGMATLKFRGQCTKCFEQSKLDEVYLPVSVK